MNIRSSLQRTWLRIKSDLTNPTYNGLAQATHAGVSYAIIFTAGILCGWVVGMCVAGGFVVFGIWKEFRFDPKYERPEVSGGIRGGEIDLLGYLGGIIPAAVLLTLLHFGLAPMRIR